MKPLVDYIDLTLVNADRALYVCRSLRVLPSVVPGCEPMLYAFNVVMN